jgi:dTDP-4-dehydrorhamnose reductase
VGRRVAITGAAGQLGREVVRAFGEAGDEVLALVRPDFDIAEASHLARLTAWRPDVVVNAAAWTDVDACARDPERAMLINGQAAGAVARAAADAGALAVQVSTNEVFDGQSDRPYTEDDLPNPINPYGVSKLAGEHAVVDANPRHLVVRTAWLYGGGARNFPGKIRQVAERMVAEERPLRVVADEWGNPTDVRWLSSAVRRLVELTMIGEAEEGILHLAGEPATSRLDWARAILRDAPVVIEPMRLADYRRDSRVPPRAVLDVARAASLGIEPYDWRNRRASDG